MSTNTNIRNRKYKNVCLSISNYALLLYLLIEDENVSRNDTLFILGKGIDKSITKKLNWSYYIESHNKKSFFSSIIRFFEKIKLSSFWIDNNISIDDSNIYAQDHSFLAIMLKKTSYKLLSDCPNYFSINMNEGSTIYEYYKRNKSSFFGKLQKLFYGEIAVSPYGDNSHCTDIYLTEENHSPLLQGKNIHITPLQDLWNASTNSKRDFIKSVFSVSPDDLKAFENKTTIFFSQALIEDMTLTKEEYMKLVKEILSKYDPNKLIIKTHPRDKFDYSSIFPNISVYNKSINIQLLILMGLNVEKVVTICSSAVDSFPENVEIDWYANAHPKTKEYCKNTIKPSRSFNSISL